MEPEKASTRSGTVALSRHGAPDWTLAGLLICALLLRVATVVSFPSLQHPDENFQIFEQAHRLAFGYGIVPWEFVLGIRSPVLPLIFAAVFRVSEPIAGGPEGYLIVARLLLALSSLVAVAAVYRMGRRTSATHALICGLVAATWFELVYFAGRPLTEAVATTVLLVGLSLATVSETEFTPRRLAAIGFCLGLCLMLRVHLAPGLFVVALWVGRLELRPRWWPMALGGLVPVIVFGIADWFVWSGFFHSYVEAVRVNVGEDVASVFGTAPAGAYAAWLWHNWRYAMPVLEVLMIVRARRSAMWLVAAIAIIAVHSAIPHKEYRFVVPAFACLVIVAALGSADLVERARRTLAPAAGRWLIVATASLWVTTSAILAFAGPFKSEWFVARGPIMASFAAAQKADLCGVLFYDNWWFDTGGYAYLHRDVPLYAFDHGAAPPHLIGSTASFNAIVLKRLSLPDFAKGFHLRQCVGVPGSEDVCLMERAGSCARDLAMNAFLAPNAALPDAVKSERAAWTADPPGRVWHVEEAGRTSVWTRRGNTNVFDVEGCMDKQCPGAVLTIVRAGDRVMVVRSYANNTRRLIYAGLISGQQVSGWYPNGPWHARIDD